MHIPKALLLTINMVFCVHLAASQEGQTTTPTGQGYFAWIKSFFIRQKPTVSPSEESKPVSPAAVASQLPSPTKVSNPEEPKPISQAQNILQRHYQSLTKQLAETPSHSTDLSYEEIRELGLADLDADIAHLEQKIDELGTIPASVIKSYKLVPLLSQLIARWRTGNISKVQANKIIEDYKAKIDVLRRYDPSIYKYMQRLGDKIIAQSTFIDNQMAAVPFPTRGVWKEVHTLVQNICNANNMPIPKLYYGDDGTIQGSAGIVRPKNSISGRPVIFIPQQYAKNSEIENLKAAVVHELGHLYFGDTDIPKKYFLESVKSSGKFGDDFWQKQHYRREYKADIFAAFYGFGEASAKIEIESHVHETMDEGFRELLEKKAEEGKEKNVSMGKEKVLETHPTAASRLKNLLEAGQTRPGFINVPHMDLSTRPFDPTQVITADTSPYHDVIPQAAFEKMKGPIWTQRPYTGPKKIDISATPIYKKPAPFKPLSGPPDYSFRSGLQNVAAKATYILKKMPK